MTNSQIIYETAKAHGFTDEQLTQLLDAYNGDLPFHTFQEWSRRGYHVKAGEKALFSADLWKYTDKPGKAARDAAAEAGEDAPEADGHYYKKLSYLFSFSQVEKDTPAPALDVLLERFQNIPGLTVTVKGAQTASPVVWVSGGTLEHTDAIKASGGHWSAKRGAWFFKPAPAAPANETETPSEAPAPVQETKPEQPAAVVVDPYAARSAWKRCTVYAIRRDKGDEAPTVHTENGYTDGVYTYYAMGKEKKTWYAIHPAYGLAVATTNGRQAAQADTKENAERIAAAIAKAPEDKRLTKYAAMIAQARAAQ